MKRREEDMRALAAHAVRRALRIDWSGVAKDKDLVNLCAELCGQKKETICARSEFYAKIAPESLGYYLPRSSEEHRAAHLVALLTDLPPRWLFDCVTNRRGIVAEQQGGLIGAGAESEDSNPHPLLGGQSFYR
jgi:hypothetical protein